MVYWFDPNYGIHRSNRNGGLYSFISEKYSSKYDQFSVFWVTLLGDPNKDLSKYVKDSLKLIPIFKT